ncbi:MAG TPA: gluconokinase [Anaerolineaceae bacterium]
MANSNNLSTNPLILALDAGTSSVRALLFDSTGRTLEGMVTRRDYEIITRTDGSAETDIDILVGRLWECVDELLSKAGSLASQIVGVAECTIVSNMVGVDENNRAITPLMTYADTRSAPDAAWLRANYDEAYFHQRVGTLFHPSYWASRFLWMKREQPEMLRQVKRWITLGEYQFLQLFDQPGVSNSVASWTGLLNRYNLSWDEEILSLLPIGVENLSPITDVSEPLRGLRKPFATRWSSLRDVPWFPAVGDGVGANLGSGCATPNQIAVTMGTTSAVRVVLNETIPVIPPGLWCYRVDRRRGLLGGAMTEGGNIYAWLNDTLKVDRDRVDQEVASILPDSHGLTFLPLLAGERAPGWMGNARGAIAGLSLATTPYELIRAGLEGVGYRVALIYRLLRPALTGQVGVIASGGALQHSPVLMQILADAMEIPVSVSNAPEASARGAALLALESLGLIPDVSQAPLFLGDVYQPDPQRSMIYARAIERQQKLYRQVVLGKD